MICENCGRENKENARFCSECGKALIDKPIELDLNEIQIPAISRKPKIIKVSAVKSEEESAPAKDVNSLFLPKEDADDMINIPPLDSGNYEDENEPVQEFTILDNEPDSEIKRALDISNLATDFDNIEDVKPQKTKPEASETPREEKPMSIGAWIVTFILTAIPVRNIILLLIWAISTKTNKSKKSFAAAVLILSVIGAVLGGLALVLLIKFGGFNPAEFFNTKA